MRREPKPAIRLGDRRTAAFGPVDFQATFLAFFERPLNVDGAIVGGKGTVFERIGRQFVNDHGQRHGGLGCQRDRGAAQV